MPVSYLTADAVRAAERATGELLTNGTLMRRASHGVAQAVAALLAERTNGVVAVSYTHLTLPTIYSV